MTRYVVIGAGAVGATVAAQLHLAGTPVVLVARGAHLAALRADGLRYLRPDGERVLRLPAVGGPAELELTPDDVLVLATKVQDAEAALQQWSWQPVGTRMAAEVLPLLVLQNGMDSARAALRRFGTVVDAVVILAGTHLEPGVVAAPGMPKPGAFLLGPAQGGTDPASDRVAADLVAADLLVEVVPDVARWKAGKLVTNAAFNIDALYPPGPVRDRLSHGLRREATAVLTAAGTVPRPYADSGLDLSQTLDAPISGAAPSRSSTWQSLARGGPVESDYLNGEIVLLARLHGVPAPLNAGVQRRLAHAAQVGAPPGGLGRADLAALLAEGGLSDVLVDVAGLQAELQGRRPPLVLDVRWVNGDPHGRAHYEAGHLPGAVFVDLDHELASTPGGLRGRHPLPDVADLQAAARGWGLREGQSVVVYDDSGGMAAARAWWLLRWAGVEDVRILDGALAAWRRAGLAEQTGASSPGPAGDVTLTAGHLPVLSDDEAADLPRTGILLDARAGERFRGEVEPFDPVAGRIPGAVNAPTTANLDADGHFLDPGTLRSRWAVLGALRGAPVGVYCGSGVTAAHELAALAVAGVQGALYAGSWSAWCADPARPVATGPA